MTRDPEPEARLRRRRTRAAGGEPPRSELDGVVLLTAEQLRRLRRRPAETAPRSAELPDVGTKPAEHRRSAAAWLGVLALAAAAGLALNGAGPHLPAPARCAALIALPLAATLAAGACARSPGLGSWAEPLAAAAFAALAAGLGLLESLLGAPPSPLPLLGAGAFGIALAHGLGLRLLLALGLFCLAGFAVAGPAAALGLEWTSLWLRPEPFLAPGLVLLGVVGLFPRAGRRGFDAVYRWIGLSLVLGPVAALSVWGDGTLLPLPRGRAEALYQGLGLLASAAALGLGLWRRWPETVQLGASALLALLGSILYDWWWADLPPALFFAALTAAALALAASLLGLRALVRRAAP